MKKLLCLASLAGWALVPFAAPAATSGPAYGAGPHGYDWAIGSWSCVNAMSSAMGGPARQTLTVRKTDGGAIYYRSTGTNFDNSWYNVYVPSKRMWVSPFIVADGSYGTESTMQSGPKIVWVGTATDGTTNRTMQIRDTEVITANHYSDYGEMRTLTGHWKEQYNVVCRRV